MVDTPLPPDERMHYQQQFGGRQPEQRSSEPMPPAPQQQQQRRPRASKWDVEAPEHQPNRAQLAAGGRPLYAEPAPPPSAAAAIAAPAYGGQPAAPQHPRGHADGPAAYGSSAGGSLPPTPVMQQQPQPPQMVAAAPANGGGGGVAEPEQQRIWFYIDPKASNERGPAPALLGSCPFAALYCAAGYVLASAELPQS